MDKRSEPIYIAQVHGALAARRRMVAQAKLDAMKRGTYDKSEFKRLRKQLLEEYNRANIEMAECHDEVWRQNHMVISAMLQVFTAMDVVTRAIDDAADVFSSLTVGDMKTQLADFINDCRRVAAAANAIVTGIDSAGNEQMSLAYADIADSLTDGLMDTIRERIEDYADTPNGRKNFYGYNR